jgi:YD repeat-containing protein
MKTTSFMPRSILGTSRKCVIGTILSDYSYTGGGRPAIIDLPEPKVKLDYFQGTSGTYAGWDRFGRTRQQYWSGYGGTANVDRVYYNWSNFVKKSSGMTDLDQFRTVNDVNEIVDITETTGPSWVTPGYDAAGSMTTIFPPGSPSVSYTATYDAWHRLVKLTDGSTTIAEYEYDATKQRIVKSLYVSGVLDQRHHFYYNDQ